MATFLRDKAVRPLRTPAIAKCHLSTKGPIRNLEHQSDHIARDDRHERKLDNRTPPGRPAIPSARSTTPQPPPQRPTPRDCSASSTAWPTLGRRTRAAGGDWARRRIRENRRSRDIRLSLATRSLASISAARRNWGAFLWAAGSRFVRSPVHRRCRVIDCHLGYPSADTRSARSG